MTAMWNQLCERSKFTLHARRNDIRTEIAKATIDLVISLKSNENLVTMYSGIVPRLEELINIDHLVQMCMERNISFLSHPKNIDPSKLLNESKMHWNNYGIKVFKENY